MNRNINLRDGININKIDDVNKFNILLKDLNYNIDIKYIFWARFAFPDYFMLMKLNNGNFLFIKMNEKREIIEIEDSDPENIISQFTNKEYKKYIEDTHPQTQTEEQSYTKCVYGIEDNFCIVNVKIEIPDKIKTFAKTKKYVLPEHFIGRRNQFIDIETGEEIFYLLKNKNISYQEPIMKLNRESVAPTYGEFKKEGLISWNWNGLWYDNEGLKYGLNIRNKGGLNYLIKMSKYIYEFIPKNENIMKNKDYATFNFDNHNPKHEIQEFDGVLNEDEKYHAKHGVFWRLKPGFTIRNLYYCDSYKIFDKQNDLYVFFLKKVYGGNYLNKDLTFGCQKIPSEIVY